MNTIPRSSKIDAVYVEKKAVEMVPLDVGLKLFFISAIQLSIRVRRSRKSGFTLKILIRGTRLDTLVAYLPRK